MNMRTHPEIRRSGPVLSLLAAAASVALSAGWSAGVNARSQAAPAQSAFAPSPAQARGNGGCAEYLWPEDFGPVTHCSRSQAILPSPSGGWTENLPCAAAASAYTAAFDIQLCPGDATQVRVWTSLTNGDVFGGYAVQDTADPSRWTWSAPCMFADDVLEPTTWYVSVMGGAKIDHVDLSICCCGDGICTPVDTSDDPLPPPGNWQPSPTPCTIDAQGEGNCDAILGIIQKCGQCVVITGCRCVGADCALLEPGSSCPFPEYAASTSQENRR